MQRNKPFVVKEGRVDALLVGLFKHQCILHRAWLRRIHEFLFFVFFLKKTPTTTKGRRASDRPTDYPKKQQNNDSKTPDSCWLWHARNPNLQREWIVDLRHGSSSSSSSSRRYWSLSSCSSSSWLLKRNPKSYNSSSVPQPKYFASDLSLPSLPHPFVAMNNILPPSCSKKQRSWCVTWPAIVLFVSPYTCCPLTRQFLLEERRGRVLCGIFTRGISMHGSIDRSSGGICKAEIFHQLFGEIPHELEWWERWR